MGSSRLPREALFRACAAGLVFCHVLSPVGCAVPSVSRVANDLLGLSVTVLVELRREHVVLRVVRVGSGDSSGRCSVLCDSLSGGVASCGR